MLEFIGRYETLLWWLAIVSAVMLFASVVAVPFLVVRIPEDYFAHRKRPRRGRVTRHPLLKGGVWVLKNLLGVLFVLAGVAMLLLPGQGILTILAGLFLIDFPGKYAAERWLVRRPAVLRSINWLRVKLKAPPLIGPQAE